MSAENNTGDQLPAPHGTGQTNLTEGSLVDVFIDCACDRDITAAELAVCMNLKSNNPLIGTYLGHLNQTFKKFGINSCLCKAHFLAQVGHESGSLKFTVEQGDPEKLKKKYDGYHGRGLLQVTWDENYEAYAKYIGTTSEKIKEELERPEHAALSAGWFWSKYKLLNEFAEKNDFILITAKINGGFNGWNDRLARLQSSANILLVNHCSKSSQTFDFEKFESSKSEANKSWRYMFRYGYWFDPESSYLVKKNATESKYGYRKFLEYKGSEKQKDFEFIHKNSFKKRNGEVGFPYFYDMIQHAENRVSKLD